MEQPLNVQLIYRRDFQLRLNFLSLQAKLQDRNQVIEDQNVEMFGVERSILSQNSELSWRAYFLKDGYVS